jgi:L-2-hydroxyglutarate oxidase LhgO
LPEIVRAHKVGTMTERTDCIVIGAGVVGLGIARALAMAGREVIILEAEDAFGLHTSSRNTGCIHAGIHYLPGSLKNRLAFRGKELLYRYCPEHGVGHKQIGKLVVAIDEAQIPALHALKEKANANGLQEIDFLPKEQIHEMEPELRFKAALFSSTSGIVDAPELMRAYLGDAEDHGAVLALNAPVRGGRVIPDGIELDVGGAQAMTIACTLCVNAAGHNAADIARSIAGIPAAVIPDVILARGCYFVAPSKRPFTRLIYPLPQQHAHAVHVSPDMGGQVRFGPDTEFIDEVDYTVDPARAPWFYEAARLFWPGIEDGDLAPGWAGIRPKLSRERANDIDFMIQGPADHGIPGLVSLYGLESPGLTSSMAIGEYVTEIAKL